MSARERMMCGERVKVPVLVSANFCLCWLVPTFVCVGQCQLLFVLVSANFCFHHTCIYEITGSGFRSVV